MRRPATIALALLCAIVGVSGQAADTATVVSKAADYIQQYEKQLSAVVGEERQTQRVVRADGSLRRQRDLVSDLLLVRTGDGVRMFRDVLEVDGKPVRDREERLRNLFLNPARNARDQLSRISRESARHNLGVTRVLDSLMLPLWILNPKVQPRFTFTVADGVLRFQEMQSPTLIRSGPRDSLRDVPLRGWLMIDDAGRLRGANMLGRNDTLDASADLRYEENADVKLLVPVTMQQRYRMGTTSRAEVLEVSSSYAKWRRFEVTTSETIVPPR